MDQRMRRSPGEMNRYLSSHKSDSSSRRRCRFAPDMVSGTSELSRVASTCIVDCDASGINFAIKKDNKATASDETTRIDASCSSTENNTLSLRSASSVVDRFSSSSSSEETNRSACNCSIINHRKQEDSSSSNSTARRYFHRSRIFSAKERFYDRLFRSPIARRINIVFLICIMCVSQCAGLRCAPGLETPGCKFIFFF